jgi:hypothetical protein
MAGDAKETAKQENGSRVYFELVIEKNKDPVRNYSELATAVKKVYPNVNIEWMNSYAKQAVALKKYIGINKGYEYSRDDGFMPFIEGIAKKHCGVSIKDRWDPADIYMVKKNKKSEIEKRIVELTKSNDTESNLLALNDYMRSLMVTLDMLPVSLKAIKKSTSEAKVEPANAGGSKGKGLKFQVVPGSVKCLLDFGHKNADEFDTGEFAFDFKVADEEIHGQARNFQYSVARNLVQTDLTPKGRSGGAKLGKVSSEALDTFLRKAGLPRPASASKDPNIDSPGEWKAENIKYWIEFITNLKNHKIAGRNIDLGDLKVKVGNKETSGADAVIRTAILSEGKTRSSSGRFSSKLIGLRWAYCWVIIEQKGLMEDWLKTLYYGAKKEFGGKNGPFLKIY